MHLLHRRLVDVVVVVLWLTGDGEAVKSSERKHPLRKLSFQTPWQTSKSVKGTRRLQRQRFLELLLLPGDVESWVGYKYLYKALPAPAMSFYVRPGTGWLTVLPRLQSPMSAQRAACATDNLHGAFRPAWARGGWTVVVPDDAPDRDGFD